MSFALDPVLLEILRPEVEGHLEVVDAWLGAVRDRGPQRVEDRLLRSVHTMNGAFAMTEVAAITGVTAPLEGYLKRAMGAQHVPGEHEAMLVEQATFAVRQTLEALAEPEARLPQFPALADALRAARDALPEAGAPIIPHDDLSIVPVDLGGIDTTEIPRFDAPIETLEPSTPAETPLPLDALADAPLAPTLDVLPVEAMNDEAAVPTGPLLPPADDADAEPERAHQLYRRYLREGPYVPWGERFGQECPAPDFDKVERELRAARIAQLQRAAIWTVPPLLALGLAVLWWRRRRSR